MKLCIPLKIWQQMRAYTLLSAPNEITGLGTIMPVGDNLVVDQIFIPQQHVSPGYCESSEAAINEIVFNVVEDNPARAGELRFRWHSHANGSVFWSATDETDINAWKGPWVVNLVMNTRDDCLARLDLFRELRVSNISLEVKIDSPIPTEIIDVCQQEIVTKVKQIPIAAQRLKDLKPGHIATYATMTQDYLKGGEVHEDE